MYYEDLRLKPGDTVSGLATEYCHKAADWEKIWKDPKNLGVVSMRKDPANVRRGDLLHMVDSDAKCYTHNCSGSPGKA